jgi:YD repeat-containing protein
VTFTIDGASYSLDANGNMLTKTDSTDRKGQTIQYVYDALNRLTKKQYPNDLRTERCRL